MKGTGNPQIIVYTGDGKGKTTADMGQMLRALGHGGKCAVIQFIKQDPSKLDCGEWKEAQQLGVLWKSFGSGFSWEGDNKETNKAFCIQGWEQAKRWISSGDFDLLVLDEFTYAFTFGYLDPLQIALWLDDHHGKKGFPNLVITGRGCPDALVSIADIVSEVKEIKHSFAQKGREPLPMIEF
jgi:cob(I)alamin adenosyltransferase